jgi:wyosine [tRNA(Phe)-imidazoG37] synthetase (radical SAM superfamily)
MSQILELKRGLTYGPVNSRRLGRSLGINILPSGTKLCSLDCAYCQYGWTGAHEAQPKRDYGLPSPADVRAALEAALLSLPEPPAYLTFSGNGEPTLHPRFPAMVEEARAARDRLAPSAKTAILSNSTTSGDPAVRAALLRLDVRIMKLDAGTEATFARYSRPCAGIDLEAITRGLVALSAAAPIAIQTLFTTGRNGNLGEDEIEAWRNRLLRIRPQSVQIYTLARGYPDKDIAPATLAELLDVQAELELTGQPSRVF